MDIKDFKFPPATPALERHAKDFALVNGIGLRSKTTQDDDILCVAPITLYPSPFPSHLFDKAKRIQESVNTLMHRVAYDDAFLVDSLQSTIRVDDFTKGLLDIHLQVAKAGFAQNTSLGLLRADYMLHEVDKGYELRQVEVNAIASGFCGLAPRVSSLHESVLRQAGFTNAQVAKHCPKNFADTKMVSGMIKAWDVYGKPGAIILFVVEERTINIGDQRRLQFTLNELRPDIIVVRKSFTELVASAKLGSNNELLVDSKEVALVYYRHGYAPEHYPEKIFWDLRLLIEKSKAIKCPSVRYQLAGTKKVQQILAGDKILEKYHLAASEIKALKSTFAGMWGLEANESGKLAVEMTLSNPERFVMKPQREGGGNNIYGTDIPGVLNPIKDSPTREQYVIMELIRTPVLQNYILQAGTTLAEHGNATMPVVGELGIYGVVIGDSNSIETNYEASHVLRSKKQGVTEGGIAAGFGAIDSPYLV